MITNQNILKKRETLEDQKTKINGSRDMKKEISNSIVQAYKSEGERQKKYNLTGEDPKQSSIQISFDKNEKEMKSKLKNKRHGDQKTIQIGFSEKKMKNLKDKKYWIDIMRLPKISFIFQKIDYQKALNENRKFMQTRKKSKSKKKKVSFIFSKPKKGEISLIITARMMDLESMNKIISYEEAHKCFNDIRKQINSSKIEKKEKIKSEDDDQKKQKGLVNNWKQIGKMILSNKKFFIRTEVDQNRKRVAQMCQKEWKRSFTKTRKGSNEVITKIKKLKKEIGIYLKKRIKDLNEIKKKREKIEDAIKKTEEEKREKRKQQRKIEFLIKQSGIYADFMASKLGFKKSQVINKNSLVKLTQEEKEQAESNVKNIINQQLNQVTDYEKLNNVNDLNFADVQIDENSRLVDQPTVFQGTLKSYQIKGLRWLDNLYAQGINGILADEMGLGKTIQVLALLGHLSEKKNNWGPFLVIAPAITLFNWFQEAKRFIPHMNVLPYWGCQKDRKIIKKYFQQKYLGQKSSKFHLIVTSYQLAVADEKTLQRVRWQYIILDEAQAIKNINSLRWNTLLGLKSRNKLLLTGTPIQNTMAELWALLHFIMPQLFDSHEQFKEWFSKDIEASSQEKNKLNQKQLDRLHEILKPFMLRRVKKDVEKELGQKFEHEIFCELSKRQQNLYQKIKSKISIESFFHLKENKEKVKNLMNLVVQFRKVCNHPELFERRLLKTSLIFTAQAFIPQRYYFNSKDGMKSLFGTFKGSHLSRKFPLLLERFETQMKSNQSYSFLLMPVYHHYKNMIQLSEIEFEMLINPTMNNFYNIVVLIHYIHQRQKQGFYLKLFKEKRNLINYEMQNKLSALLIYKQIYIQQVVAYRPILFRYKKMNNISHKLWQKSPIQNIKIEFPPIRNIITDSSKMIFLEKLLFKIKANDEKVLIFCQMTKMMDIIEEFLIFKKYNYFRLDGATSISDRRDMVNEYQVNRNIFVFLLSTRAGGLGVTLTAADVVIFYDNDWNPTMDAQAADRAHRIGRTKDINIYKLITKNTIEERIVERAKQKKTVQQTVYSGEVFKANFSKPHEIVNLVFDKNELKERKELRNKNALLHVKRTGKNVHKVIKEKKKIEKVVQKQNEKKSEIKIKENDRKEIEIQFDDVLNQLQDKFDLSKYLDQIIQFHIIKNVVSMVCPLPTNPKISRAEEIGIQIHFLMISIKQTNIIIGLDNIE